MPVSWNMQIFTFLKIHQKSSLFQDQKHKIVFKEHIFSLLIFVWNPFVTNMVGSGHTRHN